MPDIAVAAHSIDQPVVERILSQLEFNRVDDIGAAQALLVIIAEGWSGRLKPDLQDRIETGIRHPSLPVVPVLIDDATLPDKLPEGLRALAYISPIIVRTGSTFERDTDRLGRQISRYLRDTRQTSRFPLNLVMVVGIVIFGVILLFLARLQGEDETPGIIPTSTMSVPEDTDGAIMIGVAAALDTDRGIEIERGVQLALADRPDMAVDLLVQDSRCASLTGLQVAELFTSSPDVAGVIGHQCDVSCLAAAPIYTDAGYAAITPGCTTPALADFSTYRRTVPSRAQEAVAAAEYVRDNLGNPTVAVVHDEQILAGQMARAFAAAYEASEIITVETGSLDLDALVDDIQGAGLVYFVGRTTTAAELVKRLDDQPFMLALGEEREALVELAAASGVYVVTVIPPTLDERYQQAYGEAPTSPIYAYAYDATIMLLDSLVLNENGTVDRNAIRDRLDAYTATGISGPLDCDGGTDCARIQIEVEQLP